MIGIVIAMKSEAEILLSEMKTERSLLVSGQEVFVGTAFGKDVVLVVCGVGKVNAALGVALAVHKFGAEKILNFGVAGGRNRKTELCKVYSIAKAVQFDFDLTQLNGTKMGTLDEYETNYLPLSDLGLDQFQKRNLGTADRFNDSPADFLLLTNELKADIRDMEGCAIVQAATKMQLPVYAFKAISDVAGSGSTTEQYLKNKNEALENLKAALPDIFAEL